MQESTKFNGKRNNSKGRGYCFARSPIKRPIIRTAQTDFCDGYLLLSLIFRTSARPYIYVVATLPAATSFRSQKSIGFSTHRSYSIAMPSI